MAFNILLKKNNLQSPIAIQKSNLPDSQGWRTSERLELVGRVSRVQLGMAIGQRPSAFEFAIASAQRPGVARGKRFQHAVSSQAFAGRAFNG